MDIDFSRLTMRWSGDVGIITGRYVSNDDDTEIELWAELFSLLDERIQNMSEQDYQEYKKSKRIFYLDTFACNKCYGCIYCFRFTFILRIFV